MPTFPELMIGGIAPVYSTALEAAHQLATKSGSIETLTVLNTNATARFVLLLDQLTSPAGQTTLAVTPIWAFPVNGLSTTPGTLSVDWTVGTMQFKNGLWVVLSTVLTTPFSLTTAGADGYFSALVQTS